MAVLFKWSNAVSAAHGEHVEDGNEDREGRLILHNNHRTTSIDHICGIYHKPISIETKMSLWIIIMSLRKVRDMT